jgi:uncharacterized protein YceK
MKLLIILLLLVISGCVTVRYHISEKDCFETTAVRIGDKKGDDVLLVCPIPAPTEPTSIGKVYR